MMGAGLSYLLLPLISQAYGWRSAPMLYLLPVLAVAMLLWLFADDPNRLPPPASPTMTAWQPSPGG